jgi:hypothetical protein
MRVADVCVPCRIAVRGLTGMTDVYAWRLGDWAAHRQLDTPQLFGLTLLPIGLSLPFCWASFRTLVAAAAAMREVARLRNSWSIVTQADFTAALRAQLETICRRHGAIEGPIQMQWPADTPLYGGARLNGYRDPRV